ncbi:molybdenum cofactor guanylyltransferase MobA [Zavarzinia sp.]|uniref:molybdenum cofactor guanylyltransferase MobA n=1 Tax=Zavarzinia sp. TaxID=2027920 RepID=UPI00356873F0
MSDPRPLGLILAGGRARRLGGGDKTLLPLGGRPLLGHVIERLAPQCAELLLNANGDPARFAGFGLAVVPDPVAGQPGPLAGVLAGLRRAGSRRLLTVPGDAPFLPADLAQRLAAAGGRIAVAASGGRVHWATALWDPTLAAPLERALVDEGIRRVEDFVRRFDLALVDFGTEGRDPFFNVNRPEDLAAAEALLP